MAGLNAGVRKMLFSGQALVVVALWCAGIGWAVYQAGASGTAWDGTGMGLKEARALVAELAPGTRVTVVGDVKLTRYLLPLARHGDRLSLEQLDPERLRDLPPGPHRNLVPGDVQVASGNSWVILQRPDFPTLLSALALVSSPQGPQPEKPAPAPPGLKSAGRTPLAGITGPRQQAALWAVAGLALPLAVGFTGFLWAARRRGT